MSITWNLVFGILGQHINSEIDNDCLWVSLALSNQQVSLTSWERAISDLGRILSVPDWDIRDVCLSVIVIALLLVPANGGG